MVLATSGRILGRVLVVAMTMLAVSCGSDEPEPVVVGAGDSAESRVLAEIYGQALARTGARVKIRPTPGGRAQLLAALDAGTVTLFPDHNGALLAELYADAAAWTPKKVDEALRSSLPQGVVVSDAADGTDLRPAVVTTADIARQHDIEDLADLGPVCPLLTAGVAPVPGLLGLPAAATKIADCDFTATRVFADADELRRALAEGLVQIGVLGGPVEALSDGIDGLAVLADRSDTADDSDTAAVRAENVLTLIRKGMLDERELEKLNYVAGELTTDELLALVRQVQEENAHPGDLARSWLDTHGL